MANELTQAFKVTVSDQYGSTEITDWIKTVTIQLGIGDFERQHIANVGKCTVVLNNSDRTFSPVNGFGIPGLHLNIDSGIRVEVGDATDGYTTVFVGTVRGITINPGVKDTNEAILDCEDKLGLLQRTMIDIPLIENELSGEVVNRVLASALKMPRASNTITFTGKPSNGQTIAVNGETYTLVTALTPLPNEVLLGSTFRDTIDNLRAVINSEGVEGTNYATNTDQVTNVGAIVNPDSLSLGKRDLAVRFYELADTTSTAKDRGANKMDGTYYGSPSQNQPFEGTDYGVTFNGLSQYATIPSFDLSTGSYAIEMWFKPYSVSGSPTLLHCDGYVEDFKIWMDSTDGNKLKVTSGANEIEGPSIGTGGWCYVFFSYAKTGHTAYLYVNDGTSVLDTSFSDSAFNTGTVNLARSVSGSNYFSGVVSKVAVYLGTHLSHTPHSGYASRAAYKAAVLASSPKRFYEMDDSTSTMDDEGSDGSDGAYVGSPTLRGHGPYQLTPNGVTDFDGVDDYVILPVENFAYTSFTWECWFEPIAGAGTDTIMSIYVSSTPGGQIALQYDHTNQRVLANFGDVSPLASANNSFPYGARYHVALTYDASGTARIYKNGFEVTNGTPTPFTSFGATFAIGMRNYTEFFRGKVDNVGVYSYDLSQEIIYDHFTAQYERVGLKLLASSPGEWGNSIPVSTVAPYINLEFGNLIHGENVTEDASIDAGKVLIEVAGDTWAKGKTSAVTALSDVVNTEYMSALYVSRSGVITFHDKTWSFRKAGAATSGFEDDSHHIGADIRYTADDAANVITVQVTPYSTLATGVVARSEAPVEVPGIKSEGNLGIQPVPGMGQSDAPKQYNENVGSAKVTLPYVDVSTGEISGAKNIIRPPVPYTDFRVSDTKEDDDGYDYTQPASRYLYTFSVAATGSGVEMSITNRALGKLFFHGLQVRGDAIVKYNPVTYEEVNESSVSLYGPRVLSVSIPLPTVQSYAGDIAKYISGRMGYGRLLITSVAFSGTIVNNYYLYDLEIGDIIKIRDYMAGMTLYKSYMITGINYNLTHGVPVGSQVTFSVYELDEGGYFELDVSQLEISSKVAV